MIRWVDASGAMGDEKADGGGGKKMDLNIWEELELPWIRRMSGMFLVGSDCGGGDVGREVITSRVPWAVATSKRVMRLGGGFAVIAVVFPLVEESLEVWRWRYSRPRELQPVYSLVSRR